mmetsp:Transcript_40748/g.102359  ORF Transcript_40748/g.102359 Transcript_40748/m.102359 type:complete len:209 (+) Transcript_40748:587-1213(+)
MSRPRATCWGSRRTCSRPSSRRASSPAGIPPRFWLAASAASWRAAPPRLRQRRRPRRFPARRRRRSGTSPLPGLWSLPRQRRSTGPRHRRPPCHRSARGAPRRRRRRRSSRRRSGPRWRRRRAACRRCRGSRRRTTSMRRRSRGCGIRRRRCSFSASRRAPSPGGTPRPCSRAGSGASSRAGRRRRLSWIQLPPSATRTASTTTQPTL